VGGATQSASGPGAAATLSLVIPAYNEEARLPALLDTLATSAVEAVADGGFELRETLVVDDGSDDRTPAILAEAESMNPKLRSVRAGERNAGKGAAIAAGVRHAEGDYVLLADVDLSTPLEELPKLSLAIRSGADLAVGSRALDRTVVDRGPVHRKLMGRVFNDAVRLMTGLELRDTQCGFKLMPTGIAKTLLAEQTCPGFSFDVELLMRADRAGLRIAEVPVVYVHDSRSRVRVISSTYRMLRDVAGLSYRLRRQARLAGPGAPTGLSADNSD
jgi:dolichyl-phosphate beta-glucosyltransferase